MLRLGRLRWTKGSVPTPHHLIFVEASGVVESAAVKE
jgi:hypothetical protein